VPHAGICPGGRPQGRSLPGSFKENQWIPVARPAVHFVLITLSCV
jgi:hypothetical protein